MERNNNKAAIPQFLKDLIQPTPSSVTKLIAAWDGLNHETQILVLSEIDKKQFPTYLTNKVKKKALDSNNAYIRYLAARGFYFSEDSSDEEKKLKNRIEQDPDPLVRYSISEHSSILSSIVDPTLNSPDLFFDLPHEERLAKIRSIHGNGEKIANLISGAIDKQLKEGKVTKMELYEILADYLVTPGFRENYTDSRINYDGWGEYQKGKDLEMLWALAPKIPEGISNVLIENLPGEPSEEVIRALSDYQLKTLLYRRDIQLKDLRKRLFFENGNRMDSVKDAAISSNFQLEHYELNEILKKPPKERVSILKDLSSMASDLNLACYAAIHDALFVSNVSPLGNDFEYAIGARDSLERRIKNLEGWKKERELTELRIYNLAKEAVPWKSSQKGCAPTDVLGFLSEKIVPGDTWETFMAFSKEWDRRYPQTKKLHKHLPKLYEVDEEDDTQEDLLMYEEENKIEGPISPGSQKKTGFIEDDDNGLEVPERQLVVPTTAEINSLRSDLKKQKVLLYVLIGLAFWIGFLLL